MPRVWLYRAITLLGVFAALVAILFIQQHLVESDEWSYYYAVQNFAHGRLVIDNGTLQSQMAEASAQSGQILEYVNLAPDRWAFEKAPGYVFYLTPFELMGVPRLGNILLLLGLAAVTYLLLTRLRDEKTAMLGVLLLLFTPALLDMVQRHYMDSLAALAFPALGGALYIYYLLREGGLRPRLSALLFFLAGLFLAFGIAVRYTNGLIALVFLLHFLITRLHPWRGVGPAAWREALYLGLGAALPLAGLLLYQWAVFGAPLATGYGFSQAPPRFAYDYLWTKQAWEIIKNNFARLWAHLLVAYPLLMLALAAFPLVFWGKLAPRLSRFRGRADAWPELPWHLFWLLGGWFLAVYGLYLMYEWTSAATMGNLPYIVLTRFYLPGLLPLVLLGALVAVRLSPRLLVSTTVTVVVLGALFFAMSAATALTYQAQVAAAAGVIPLPLTWGGHVVD